MTTADVDHRRAARAGMRVPRAAVAAIPAAEHGGRFALSDALAATREVRHDFSVCLNAFGPADVVLDALHTARADEYPDPFSRAARRAAALRWSCPVSAIALGAGAAELIHAVCHAYLRPGDDALIAEPAFGEYARAAALHGTRPRFVRGSDATSGKDALPLLRAEISRAKPRLAFIASPASPTGDVLPLEELRLLADACRAADTLLVLDQAYDAFTAAPLGTPALREHTHVLHLRSLTKDHALAGVRVAFAVAAPEVIQGIERVRVPWAASAAAQAAAVAALSDAALAHVERSTAALRAEALRIAARCSELGLETSRSSTHYLAIRCGNGRAARELLLAERGILVRDCESFGMPEWIRVAARTPSETDALIAALDLLRERSRHREQTQREEQR